MMKSLSFQSLLLLCFASVTANAAISTSTSGREYTEAMLLFSENEFDIRLGAKSLNRQNSKNESMFDMLAEIAWSACSGKRKMQPDTLAWLAKSIGQSKDGRYASLVDDCLAQVTDKAPIKHFTEAKKTLAASPTQNPFVGGKLDLDKARADLIKNRKKGPADGVARTLFEDLKTDQRLEDVYSKLGAPEKISAINVPRGKAGVGFVKIKLSDDRIVFHYPGLGEATFGYDSSAADWLLINAKSTNELQWLEHDGRFATKMDVITDGGARDLRQLTKMLMKQNSPIETTLLDRVADRIYHSQMEDGEMVDPLAHMCKLLGKSNNGKYKQVMREVSEKAVHATLRKYAQRAADSLPDPSEANYVPKKIGK